MKRYISYMNTNSARCCVNETDETSETEELEVYCATVSQQQRAITIPILTPTLHRYKQRQQQQAIT